MRRNDAGSLARTLMAAGARVVDREVGIPEWDDAQTPRTDNPVRFYWGHRYERSIFGTLLAVVPFTRIA